MLKNIINGVDMHISNIEKAKISYDHKEEIQRLFKDHVKGNLCIDHFSINVFFGNGESMFFSPTPQMAEELCKHDFVSKDSNYKPETYQNFKLYPWRSVQKNETDRIINFVKEEKFGMRSGTMIVRNLGGGRHVMYSFATHKKDNFDYPGQFNFLFHCKANYIAELGDFLYDNLLQTINHYSNKSGIVMPKIDILEPINIESNFYKDEQREAYERIKNNSSNAVKIIQKQTGPFLRLINGGKVEN